MTANRIIAHMFQQSSLHQVDETQMEKLLREHPYFSAARLLLAKKVYQHTGDLQNSAIKQALLYTNQPHYAYHLIMEEPILSEVEDRVAPIIPEDVLPSASLSFAEAAIPLQNGNEITAFSEADLSELSLEETKTVEENLPDAELGGITEEEVVPVPAEDVPIPEETTEEAVIPVQDLPAEDLPIPEEIIEEAVAPVQDLPAEDWLIPEETIEEAVTPVQDLPAEEKQAPSITLEIPKGISVTHPSEVVLPVFLASSWKPVEETKKEDLTETVNELNTILHTPAAQDNNTPDAETPQKETIKIFPFERPKIEETELIFQPLYTDDYFAYKRLKNPEEADELNAQGAAEMRSFTSWLRRMKEDFASKSSKDWYQQQLNKIYDEDEAPEISETVEKMAVNSLTFNNDIVSETLAEIWVKQQQYDNAIKIYQKLSLLNPDKNAYFAQKILELKTLTDKNKK